MELVQEKIEGIARITHEANRAYCLMLGDTSQPHWEEAPQWQKDSAVAGVERILSQEGLTRSDPRGNHESWMEQKLRDGWTFGEVKDAEKKTHPCLLPYDSLPDDQKLKDVLFGAVCAAFKWKMQRDSAARLDREMFEAKKSDVGEKEQYVPIRRANEGMPG